MLTHTPAKQPKAHILTCLRSRFQAAGGPATRACHPTPHGSAAAHTAAAARGDGSRLLCTAARSRACQLCPMQLPLQPPPAPLLLAYSGKPGFSSLVFLLPSGVAGFQRSPWCRYGSQDVGGRRGGWENSCTRFCPLLCTFFLLTSMQFDNLVEYRERTPELMSMG